MQSVFDGGYDTARLISALQIETGVRITPDDTLIIFDEVQEVPRALTSLKYFNENAPEYDICAAGSLLGVSLHQGTSFPVGKVDFLDLYPLTFDEFLRAVGKERYADLLHSDLGLAGDFKKTYSDLLAQYYYVGGMPEPVLVYSESNDYTAVRSLQKSILSAYEQDFFKHAPNEILPRLRMLWQSVPAQLARESKKFA